MDRRSSRGGWRGDAFRGAPAGLAFCELFRRYRNIYTLAIAQAILGMCLAAAVPDAWHHHMRVGIGYLSWIGR